MSTELVINPRIAQWAVEAVTRLFATYAFISGAVIAVSDERRFSATMYQDVVDLPGFPLAWGLVLALTGAMTLAASVLIRPRWVALGAYVVTAWELFYSLAVLRSVLRSTETSLVPVAVHLAVAVACVVLAVTYTQSRRQ